MQQNLQQVTPFQWHLLSMYSLQCQYSFQEKWFVGLFRNRPEHVPLQSLQWSCCVC